MAVRQNRASVFARLHLVLNCNVYINITKIVTVH